MTYPDRFRSALPYSHGMTARGELWRDGAKQLDVNFIEGSVTADRGAVVRRTLQCRVDPRLHPTSASDLLTPYGTYIKVFRGMRYPDGTSEEFNVFFGRIDAIDMTTGGLEIRASDLAADLVDARFEQPRATTPGLLITEQFDQLVHEVFPTVTVVHNVTSTERVSQVTWDRERSEALDALATAIAGEWFAGPDGNIYIGPGPDIQNPDADPVWLIDAGETGVLISTDSRMERQNIYNGVVVNGEPTDRPPVFAVAHDDNPDSPLRWGGPFGRVPRFYSSQFIYTQEQADNTARKILASELSPTKFLNIETVPNPLLMLSDLVQVTGAGEGFDGVYYVSSFELPLNPEDPMRLAVYAALALVADVLVYRQPTGRFALPSGVG